MIGVYRRQDEDGWFKAGGQGGRRMEDRSTGRDPAHLAPSRTVNASSSSTPVVNPLGRTVT